MKNIVYVLLIVSLMVSCHSNSSTTTDVVATNAWTGAYALAAGASEVRILTPYEMMHPSEYELRPGDIVQLYNAELVIYAGYEIMVDQIKTGLKIPEEKLLQIKTSYDFDEIEHAVMLIANKLETVDLAKENLADIKHSLEKARQAFAKHGLENKPAIVHVFQQSFAQQTGINIVDVFGPAPPEPRLILSMTQTGATLILDNDHNPAGGSLKETLRDANYLLLLNFPGLYDTRTLQDVIEYNTRQLVDR